MGRSTRSVAGFVGLLTCLLHHACALVVVPGIQMYDMPTALAGLQYNSASGIPVSGKTYIAASSAQNRGAVSRQAQLVRPSYVVGQTLSGYQRTPNVYTVTARRPVISRVGYTSVPTASTYRIINRNYRPAIVRQPTTHYVQTLTGSGSIIPQRRTPTIGIQTRVARRRISSRGPVLTRIATSTIGSSSIGQQPRGIPSFIPPQSIRTTSAVSSRVGIAPKAQQPPRGIPSFIPPSSIRATSAVSSRVGIAPKAPYVKKTNVGVQYVKKSTKKPYIQRSSTVKKYTKKSSRSKRRKSKKSSKSKAKRKAELKAKLKALRAKRKLKSKMNALG